MMDVRGANPARQGEVGAGWGWILAYGIVSVVLGITAFVWPFTATFAATVVIGAFFFVAGGFAIAAALFGHGSTQRGYSILFGVLSLIVGLVMLLEPATGALSLTLMVAVWLGVRGVLELIYGVRLKRGRGMLIALGVINVLLALFILATVPFSALALPGYILGISFIFGGATSITAAADHRKGASAFAVPS